MRISDWSSDVCSSDLLFSDATLVRVHHGEAEASADEPGVTTGVVIETWRQGICSDTWCPRLSEAPASRFGRIESYLPILTRTGPRTRSEEHTSELQSLMRISYAVFCLKKKKNVRETRHDVPNYNKS